MAAPPAASDGESIANVPYAPITFGPMYFTCCRGYTPTIHNVVPAPSLCSFGNALHLTCSICSRSLWLCRCCSLQYRTLHMAHRHFASPLHKSFSGVSSHANATSNIPPVFHATNDDVDFESPPIAEDHANVNDSELPDAALPHVSKFCSQPADSLVWSNLRANATPPSPVGFDKSFGVNRDRSSSASSSYFQYECRSTGSGAPRIVAKALSRSEPHSNATETNINIRLCEISMKLGKDDASALAELISDIRHYDRQANRDSNISALLMPTNAPEMRQMYLEGPNSMLCRHWPYFRAVTGPPFVPWQALLSCRRWPSFRAVAGPPFVPSFRALLSCPPFVPSFRAVADPPFVPLQALLSCRRWPSFRAVAGPPFVPSFRALLSCRCWPSFRAVASCSGSGSGSVVAVAVACRCVPLPPR